MAIGHLSVKVGKPGKAGPHAAYIAREGRYADRLDKGERLEAKEAGNMPAWAQINPLEFWQAADQHERANGTTYREFEIALPRELTAADRLALVREFVRQEIGDRHAYQFAIHCPTAVDGQEQPHAHIMFSERQRDGIERDPGQYFKRHNARAPEKGGAKKGWGDHAGETRTRQERAADLKALRQRWEQTCNAALERAGHAERIDLRSNAERGINLPAERKFKPSEWRTRRAEVIEFRQARAELARTVPDAAAEIINLEQRRREAERKPTDYLAGFRASVERAEADGGLALDVAKAQLTVAQEYQEEGKNPLHHLEAILQEGQARAFASLQKQFQAERESQPLESDQKRPLEAAQSHEKRHPLQKEGETLDQTGWRLRAAFIKAERDAWREDKAAREREEGAAHAARMAELQQKRPWFGREKWAQEVAEAERLARLCERRAQEALSGEEDHYGDSQWTKAADRRLDREYPELREAMTKAAAREEAERLAQARERQAAQKDRQQGHHRGPRRSR